MLESSHSDIDNQMLVYSDLSNNNILFPLSRSKGKNKLTIKSLFQIIKQRNESIKFNTFSLIIVSIKFIITFFSLIIPSYCEEVFIVWLIITCFYDGFIISARIILIYNLKNKAAEYSSTPSSTSSQENPYSIKEVSKNRNNKCSNFFHNQAKVKKVAEKILEVGVLVYLALFIWGQVIFFKYFPYSSCEGSSFQTVVLFVNIIWGYIYIGLPLLLLVMGCICFGGFHVSMQFIKTVLKNKKRKDSGNYFPVKEEQLEFGDEFKIQDGKDFKAEFGFEAEEYKKCDLEEKD